MDVSKSATNDSSNSHRWGQPAEPEQPDETAEPTVDAVRAPRRGVDPRALVASALIVVGAATFLWQDDKVRSVCKAVATDARVRDAWASAIAATKIAWHENSGTEACIKALAKWR